MKTRLLLTVLAVFGTACDMEFDAGQAARLQARHDFEDSREECRRRASDCRVWCVRDCRNVPEEQKCISTCEDAERDAKRRCDF